MSRKIGLTVIFCIEKDNIYTHLRRLHSDLPGNFKQSSHATGSIVSPQNRLPMIRLIRVIIGKRTTIPMCEQQYSIRFLRTKNSYYVLRMQYSPVKSNHICILHLYLCTMTVQFRSQIRSCSQMFRSIGYSIPEIYLLLHI